MKDKNGNKISVGDTLLSPWGYKVIVVEDYDNKQLLGKLICKKKHPCSNIPYSLNNGKGHIIIKKSKGTVNS